MSNHMFLGARNPKNPFMRQYKEYISGNSRWCPRWPPIHNISFNFLNFLPMMIILVPNHNMFWREGNPIDWLIEQINECIQLKSLLWGRMRCVCVGGGDERLFLFSTFPTYKKFPKHIKSTTYYFTFIIMRREGRGYFYFPLFHVVLLLRVHV